MIALLTGPVGVGKTTLCQRVVDAARRKGYSCGGFLTLGTCDATGRRTGLAVVDVASGQRRALARIGRDMGGPSSGRYSFDAAAIAWALAAFRRAVAARCDLIVVDEIGRLELQRGEGFAPVLGPLAGGAVARGLVVVRQELAGELARRLANVERAVFVVGEANREAVARAVFDGLFGVSDSAG